MRSARSGGSESESEEEAEALGRAEELRRERLNAVVKRNLTSILLEVTDAIFGALFCNALHSAGGSTVYIAIVKMCVLLFVVCLL